MLLMGRGMPCLYYGTELGFDTRCEPDGKVRQDMPGGWAEDKRSAFEVGGRTEEEQAWFDQVHGLLNLRRQHPAAFQGGMEHFFPSAASMGLPEPTTTCAWSPWSTQPQKSVPCPGTTSRLGSMERKAWKNCRETALSKTLDVRSIKQLDLGNTRFGSSRDEHVESLTPRFGDGNRLLGVVVEAHEHRLGAGHRMPCRKSSRSGHPCSCFRGHRCGLTPPRRRPTHGAQIVNRVVGHEHAHLGPIPRALSHGLSPPMDASLLHVNNVLGVVHDAVRVHVTEADFRAVRGDLFHDAKVLSRLPSYFASCFSCLAASTLPCTSLEPPWPWWAFRLAKCGGAVGVLGISWCRSLDAPSRVKSGARHRVFGHRPDQFGHCRVSGGCRSALGGWGDWT